MMFKRFSSLPLLGSEGSPQATDEALTRPEPPSQSCATINIGLDASADSDIFNYAREHGFTILSKDSDFRQLSFVYGAPPKVVWLRVGNCTVGELAAVLSANEQRLLEFETGLESFLVVERPE